MAEAANTSKNQDDTLLAVVATVPIIALIIHFGMSDASDFVKHYAKQGVGLSLIIVVSFVIGIIPLLGWLLSCIFSLLVFVGWVILVINVFQGNKYELPVVTDLVNQLLSSKESK